VFLDGGGDDGSCPGPGVYLVRLVTADGVTVSPAVRL